LIERNIKKLNIIQRYIYKYIKDLTNYENNQPVSMRYL